MLTGFLGTRAGGVTAVYEVDDERRELTPLRCLGHSGGSVGVYEWGYGGVGPRMLAWSILHAATGDADVADTLCHRFKWDVIARLPRPFFLLELAAVEEYLILHVARLAPPADDQVDLGLLAEDSL